VFVAGAVVLRSDHETYETYGDAVWWAFVTVTTVGYGDYTPDSASGRVTAILLMFVGVALLGVVAASLASFFGSGGDEEPSEPVNETPRDGELVAVIEQLRAEVAALRSELGEKPGPGAPRDR
jgi:voltage-gated potassium channel